MTRIWKLFRFSWKDTQKLRITQQTIRSTMSYIKDFLTKWPIKIAAKIEIASNIRIFPTQILIYWCLDLKKNQTAIQNLNFHFWGFGVNFFMMAITLTPVAGNYIFVIPGRESGFAVTAPLDFAARYSSLLSRWWECVRMFRQFWRPLGFISWKTTNRDVFSHLRCIRIRC